MIKNNLVTLDWHYKLSFSDKFLNFFSNHPFSQKRGVIFSLVDRAILLSDSEFREKNVILIIDILLNNDCPLKLIFDTINKRLKSIKVRGAAFVDRVNDNEDSLVVSIIDFIP